MKIFIAICSVLALLAIITPSKDTLILGIGAEKAIGLLEQASDSPVGKKTYRLLEAKLDAELKEIENDMSQDEQNQLIQDETVQQVLNALEKRASQEAIKVLETPLE